MPTYQYACTDPACGNRFELVQSFSDPAADECPVCALPVRKVYGSVGVVFKGSGFYRTDSRAAASAASPSKSDGGSSTKTDSKSSGAKSSDAKSTTSTTSAPATSGSGSSAKAAASA